uniref:Neur_chan_memb domain-containing protein n=1 Tax=Angiostrongylus cantonensis TaxID=6313 RepID=A0A0K0D3I2_ANGCA
MSCIVAKRYSRKDRKTTTGCRNDRSNIVRHTTTVRDRQTLSATESLNGSVMFEKRPPKLIYLTENHYAFDQEDVGVTEEQLDRLPRQLVVRRFDLFCFCFAMITYTFDVISDITTAIFHYYDGRVSSS